jgi:hypothetical protein
MANAVFFDHIEVHVDDIPGYCEFLVRIFQGGRYKVISQTGTSMFITNEGINFEVKKRKIAAAPIAAGFCRPCLRMESAKEFIENQLKLEIENTVVNPDGDCYFFTDHEGITWHIKNYLVKDKSVNW